jgi:hypothetical protein
MASDGLTKGVIDRGGLRLVMDGRLLINHESCMWKPKIINHQTYFVAVCEVQQARGESFRSNRIAMAAPNIIPAYDYPICTGPHDGTREGWEMYENLLANYKYDEEYQNEDFLLSNFRWEDVEWMLVDDFPMVKAVEARLPDSQLEQVRFHAANRFSETASGEITNLLATMPQRFKSTLEGQNAIIKVSLWLQRFVFDYKVCDLYRTYFEPPAPPKTAKFRWRRALLWILQIPVAPYKGAWIYALEAACQIIGKAGKIYSRSQEKDHHAPKGASHIGGYLMDVLNTELSVRSGTQRQTNAWVVALSRARK